jgi:thiol:disulfide interchange protein DsbD
MGDAAPSRHVQAALVAEKDAVQPGQPLVVGVRLRMDPGWHTYWRNPGDAGLPTRAKWSLPEGFQAGDLQWPRPGRFNTGPLVSFGYEHEVLLPVEIEVPATVRSKDVTLRAKVSWLECEDICLPGKAELALTLPVRPQAAPGPAAKLFETAREQMPTSDHGWGFGTSVDPGTITLKVTPPAGATLSEAYFYAITKRVLDYSPSQELRAAGGRQELVLPRKANAGPGDRLEGVLVGRSTRGPVAIEVSVPLGGGR